LSGVSGVNGAELQQRVPMTVKSTDRAAGPTITRVLSKPPAAAAREQKPAAKQANSSTQEPAAESSSTNVRFHVDKDSGKTVVAWVDASGKVLRQIPSEEAMAVAKAIDRFQGMFVNRKA
jgi:flagellar protein FlaG